MASPDRLRLLAHELTHVLQQGAAPAWAGANTAVGPLIQREPDLDRGRAVEFTDDVGTHWGRVEERTDVDGEFDYQVKDAIGKTYWFTDEQVKSATPGEPIVPGIKVRATFNDERVLDGTVEKVNPKQYYEVRVEWEDGWRIPVPYTLDLLDEYVVHPKDPDEFVPREPKAARELKIRHLPPAAQKDPHAAEYVKPGEKIAITSHALGSGVYGFAEPDAESREEAARRGR